jgi:hypothetical protein
MALRLLWRVMPLFVLIISGLPTGCATVQVNTIPLPPSTAKLRVYVYPITGMNQGSGWGVSHEEFVRRQVSNVERNLRRKGYYEVVSSDDVRSAIGEQKLALWQLERSDWALARQIGKALHADYVMVLERSVTRVSPVRVNANFDTIMINVDTGTDFRVRNTFETDRPAPERWPEMVRDAYRGIFNKAKNDMLATAVRKRGAFVPPQQEQPAAPQTEEPPRVAKAVPEPQPASPNLPGTGLIDDAKKDADAKRLVIYDFDAKDQDRTIALILVAALREEVFKLKQFVLVNREDLQKVLEEMALQQTGLIDEKQAVRTGRGLAATQVVTGQFGLLGKAYLMQAKRVDVETLQTLGLASAKFTEGQEEEELSRLPAFARALAGLP